MKAAWALGAMALVSAALLAGVNALTAPRIASEKRLAELNALAAVLPARGEFDNDPILSGSPANLPLDQGIQIEHIWPLSKAGIAVAQVYKVRSDRGYGGPIELLIGVRTRGELLAVRVLSHSETPGLGDPIDQQKSDWILAFSGLSFSKLEPKRWAVKRDGGAFDQFSGATISPRAVVEAVKATLEYARTQNSPAATISADDQNPAD